MRPRPYSNRSNDEAVAAVVGFVLIIAAAITAYSIAAQNEVPRIGARNERAWDADVGAGFIRLASAMGERAGSDAAVREILPAAPEAPSQTVALLKPLHSVRATGSLEYATQCGGATLTHFAGVVVNDLVDGAKGCLTFQGANSYAEPFSYRIELGGVLRLQGEQAAVLVGPPLKVQGRNVSLTLSDLGGTPQSIGVDRASAPVTFAPKAGALEVGSSPNAQQAAWTFTTNYPEAWQRWYQDRLGGVGLTTGITCANPGQTGPARGPCQLAVTLNSVESLSISYGRYEVALG